MAQTNHQASNTRTLFQGSDGYYKIRVPPSIVDIMGWEPGEKIHFNFISSGTNAGNLRLERIENS